MFSWQSQSLFVGGWDSGVLMSVSDVGCCWGEAVVFMAVSDAGNGPGRGRFSWQAHRLVVGGGGEVVIVLAVPGVGCGWERWGSHGSQNQFL